MFELNRYFGLVIKPDSFFAGQPSGSGRVLNYGCGNRKEPGQVGVDISDNADADYVISPGDPLPFPDGCFDMVVSRFVMEHVSDLERVLAEICRVLRPGGVFRFCVPHALSIDMYDDPTHCRFYTLRTMNYFTGASDVHYASANFSRSAPYLRLTLGWPRWSVIRYPMNVLLGVVGLIAPVFGENLLKMPFITGTLFFELEKAGGSVN